MRSHERGVPDPMSGAETPTARGFIPHLSVREAAPECPALLTMLVQDREK